MPGKSKKGGGLEVDTAFYLKSGNSPLFKMMGSSPVKETITKEKSFMEKSESEELEFGTFTPPGSIRHGISSEEKMIDPDEVVTRDPAAIEWEEEPF